MQQPADSTFAGRIAWIDGLRGIAIAAVLLFHAYVRWPEAVPFGNHFSGRWWVAYGWLGVQLFFMISGFVIALTLERCDGVGDFLRRRWLRLFPAMAIATAFVFCTAPLFPERPAGTPVWIDTLPGLLFIEPDWISWATGTPQGVLEGSFWSLFVEAKFYVIASIAYYAAGRRGMLAVLVGLFALSVVADLSPSLEGLRKAADITSARYFAWFASGAVFYAYSRSGRRADALAALLLGALAAATQRGHQLYPGLFAMAAMGLFAGTVCFPALQRAISARVLVLLGFISYPLYLIHENLLVASITKLGRLAADLPPVLLPVLPALLIMSVAWLIAAHLEPAARNALRAAGRALAAVRLPPIARQGTKP
jgi:peptidoglycan/LPS O-acetylase OafA/YrhL